MGGLLGLFRARTQEPAKTGYGALSDEALVGLIFTEGDRLPMEFAQEAISRGERLVPALAKAALDRDNWDRNDSGWCSAFHACFLLGAIRGEKAAEVLIEAFDISEDVENDWVSDEWASIFGRLGPSILERLKERASQQDADPFWRHRAMCGMAAVALRHPERKAEVFALIASIARDEDEDTDASIWAGDILLDFRLKEHEALLLSLAELPENDVYHADTVREALLKEDADLYWYQRDWLDFYAPKKIAERQKRWQEGRLSEEEAWQQAMADLEDEEREVPPLSSKQAEKLLGDLLPLARRIEEAVDFETESRSKEELLKHYSLAMEAYEAIRQDRSRFRLFDAYLEDILGWLIPLPLDLAAKGLVEEGARLSLAWSDIREPENFLADRAILLAEAGREAEAREQLDRNLKLFAQDLWIQIKSGQAYEAIQDFTAAEKCYRLARAMPDDDRHEATERLIELLKKAGKATEAETLEAEEAQRRDEARRRAEEARAAWTPVVRQGPKIGRNDPCPCGSGKKHKKCCLGKESPRQPATTPSA